MAATIGKTHCSEKYITDGVFGVLTLLTLILSQQVFHMAGESKSMEAFIRLTSPDRLENPRRGNELWEYLKETFPKGEGRIDVELISRSMAGVFLDEMQK